ncbi:MAG TPA: cell division protein FtsZ, partial [Ktedonobacterales bacterium]|nr:cell division protein FtsZ [Ktedonobacterales bacterium]
SAALAPAAAQSVVVGVGGAGNNAVNRMIEAQIRGVRFLALNTDAQALALSQATECLCLGEELTQGLGAGGNPAVGAQAAEASRRELKEALRDADLIFLAAGMGGGTGTGAAPIVAQIARELGALVVGTVTLPFSFEGSRRRKVAQEGVRILSQSVDALIVVPNDRLLQVVGKDRTLAEAFRLADDILRQGVQGMTEVITVPGLVNVDFADVRTVMQQAGLALMSIGEGSGDKGAEQAAQMAVAGGWLGASIRGAKRVLLNITGGPHLTLFEVTQIASHVREAVDENADMIFGAVINPEMDDKIRVTLVAGGMSSVASNPGTRQAFQFNEPNENPDRQAETGDNATPGSSSPALTGMGLRGTLLQDDQ